ncbi:uncharacterized protein LOC110456731 [Mizuhopecten yessoensis]|uniref:Protein kinase domain-containing protein n=1 Tax=Mizuhopecten yessoensis TaxID=6573 RepID=A0A210QAB0_MIZYE|nr:uncharacterized protein LOC110456731 [Mizuhopecten yessoensis]OWF45670.1 hypothetical protein KP79_PYT10146 [Mizuhopecten yessoensis]
MADRPYTSQVSELGLLTLALVGFTANLLTLLYKVSREFSLPKLWKYALLTIDIAHLFVGVGLILFFVFQKTSASEVCSAAGFFVQFGIFDSVCGFLTAGIILLGIYNPGKSSQISSFHRNVFLVVVIPQKIISILLSILPVIPIEFFTTIASHTVTCFKISKPGDTGDKFGILIFFIIWIALCLATITFVISAVKNWKGFNNRIHSASPNVWQAQLLQHGKTLLKFLLFEDCVWLVVLVIVTSTVYSGGEDEQSATWTVYITLGVVTIIHWVVSVIQCAMWTSCCCKSSTAVEETHRKLKRLDLIKIEAPGKIRLRVLWNISKGTVKRGLMKVYGPRHVKTWAQEIVVLGMLRKAQHPSLLQCLWTSSSNPYYETMTLITGEVITSDSRIICLELTNNGTLQDFLYRLDTPLPETCQRMIVHDIAEGLMCLHEQNILHGNLSTACVYLKGSLPSMVMRAAIGDFEDSQIYGSIHQNGDTVTLGDKRHFFLPDIRSFALVALEVVSKMCEKRFLSMQYQWDQQVANEPQTYSEANQGPGYSPAVQASANQVGDYMEVYHSDSDEEDNMLYHRRRQPPGVQSPGEVIEEIGRRSRSMSPRSRPQSAQSNKSRSRTLSPDNSRGKFLNSVQTNYPSRLSTPDSNVISPEDEYPCLPKNTPDGLVSKERPLSPERPSSGKKSPGRPKTPSKKSKNKDQAFEAFASEGKKNKLKGLKKIDSKKWLSKPGSLIRTLTGAETSVSVFKSKELRDDDAEEIDDEEIDYGPLRMKQALMARNDSSNSITFEKDRYLHRSSSKQSDQWSILSDMDYGTSHGLRKTVSTDSRSSMWSNLPLPVEMIDIEGGGERDRFETMVSQLPGMTDSLDYHPASSRASDNWNPKFNGAYKPGSYWRHDGPGPSQFELVDYYDELQGKYVKKLQLRAGINRTLSGSQIVGTPVHRTYSGTQILHKTSSGLQEILEQAESMDEDEPPQPNNQNTTNDQTTAKSIDHSKSQPVKKLKAKILKEVKSEKLLRSKSLDRITPQKKTQKSKELSKNEQRQVVAATPEPNINPEISAHRRARARKALKGALGKGNMPHVFPLQRDSKRGQKREMEVKYASVKKLQTQGSNADTNTDVNIDMDYEADRDESGEKYKDSDTSSQRLCDSFVLTSDGCDRPQATTGIRKYHSFSSNDSTSSLGSSIRLKKADVSLTSGELTSLSSQADHDIDEQTGRDPDLPSKEVLLRRTMQNKAKVVDSGFDSESSEVSSDVYGHHQHYNFSSDDSAYPDHRDRRVLRKPFRNTLKKPVDSNEWQMSEKAFVITGFSTESMNKLDTISPDTVDGRGAVQDTFAEEHVPKEYVVIDSVVRDKDFPNDVSDEEVLEDDLMNSQGKSRIIQVSAAPLTVMSIDQKAFQEQIFDNSPVPPPQPKTPTPIEDRPPTPGRSGYRQPKSAPSIENRPPTPGRSVHNRPKTPLRNTNDQLEVKPNMQHASPLVASKRYRELTMKGVPLRVSVISADGEEKCDEKTMVDSEKERLKEINDELIDNQTDDQKLFDHLESNGFFHLPPKKIKDRPLSSGIFPTAHVSRRDHHLKKKRGRPRPHRLALDEIIRELPEDKSPSPRLLSPTTNIISKDSFNSHSGSEAMLNQPSSMDESESVHLSPAHYVSPLANQPSVVVDAELYIDRVYSQTQTLDPKPRPVHMMDPDFDVQITPESKGLSTVSYLPAGQESRREGQMGREVDLDEDEDEEVTLLSGMDDKHIINCQKLTSDMHLLSFNDLLPARKENFEILKAKLYEGGQLGNIGFQLLEVIDKCWLSELPPSSSDLVTQLLDPVAETEL